MKPILLELQAFGPFAGRQAIDFRLLGDKTFFLIHGPTGSGKTSILDGICFALFGDSSGGEREGRQLRSHHADPAVPTEVSFTFALHEQRFRVLRKPEQTRPARRGGGDTKQVQTAELWSVRTDADGTEREQPLASGWGKVNDAVVARLGFRSEQFRQVVVLPQGRFFEFLKARSDGRESILQRLFGTEVYKRIEEQLRTAANALERAAAEARARRQGLLDHAGAADEAALGQRQQEQADALKSRESHALAAAAEAALAETALALAQRHGALYAESDEAVAALNGLRADEPMVERQRAQLDRARRAASIEPYVSTFVLQRQQADAAARRCEALRVELAQAVATTESTGIALRLARDREPEAERLVTSIASLEALAGKVQALAQARQAHEKAQAEAAKATAAVDLAHRSERTAADRCSALAATIHQHQLLAAAWPGLAAKQRLCDERLERATALARRKAERAQAVADAVARARAHRAARHSLAAAAAEREQVRRHWVASQAARLAQALIDGEPCPVCGARAHPLPARVDGETVSDRMLAEADSARARADGAQREAERRHHEARRVVETLDARIADARAALGDSPTDVEALRARAQAAAAEQRQAKTAAQQLQTLESDRLAAEGAMAAAQAQRIQAEATQRAAENDLRWLAGQVVAHEAGVPPDLARPALLQTALQQARAALEALRRAIDAARRAADAATSARTQAEAKLEAGEFARAALVEQSTRAAADLGTRCAAAGFADLAAYESARLDASAIAAQQAAVDDFQSRLAAAIDRRQRAEQACRDLARPDLAAATARHDMARSTQLAASNAVAAAREALAATTRATVALAALAADVQAIESRYGVLEQVAEVASGANAARMSFQRYVLATLLDEVLAATTLRLTAMSRGRYEIRRAVAATDRRFAAGLDLEVFDQYTGRARGVATLSGGESFLASLALALGLSDVVQAYAGGIRLDAIFVDEGFGTLDAEALDYAVRTLMDLQQSGRLVGIVSHVAELKERIDARLELTVSAKGSQARFRW